MKITIKNISHRGYRWLVYVIVWGWLWGYPLAALLISAVRGRVDFSWDYILPTWLALLPFFLLFLAHHFILHVFLPRKMVRTYVVAVLLLLACFCAIRYAYQSPSSHEGGEMPPPLYTEHDMREIKEIHENPDSFMKAFPHEEFADRGKRRDPPRPLPSNRMDFISKVIVAPVPMMIDILISILMLGCDFALVHVSRFQEDKEEVRKLRETHLQHELQYLKAQIHPHFFMNMLNNIHGMVEIDPAKAQEMIMELSKLMRYVLYDGAQLFNSLQKEEEFIANFVGLMRKRYSSRKVNISLDLQESGSEGIIVPSLLTLGIIENAFKHGISYKSPSFVAIKLSVLQNGVELVCDNSVHEHAAKESGEGGVGLSNLRHLLRLLYVDNFTLDIVPSHDRYHVRMIIPKKYEL